MPARSAIALAALTLFSLALATATAFGAFGNHSHASSFGTSGSGDGQFSSNSGTAVDETSGNVYVADTANFRIERFQADGTFVAAWGWGVDDGSPEYQVCTSGCQAGTSGSGAGQFEAPALVAIDNSGGLSDGDVYVADTATNLVQKFDSAGNQITSWGTGGQLNGSASPNGPFGPLAGAAVDSTGNLIVLNQSPRVFVFSQDGSFTTDFEVECCVMPAGLAADSTGDLYRVRESGAVQKFSSSGSDIEIVDPGTATGLAVATPSDELYVAHASEIARYAKSGAVIEPSIGSGDIASATGVAVRGSTAQLYASDSGNSEIDIFKAPFLPGVVTSPADNLTETGATLHGTVDPDEVAVTDCHFEYGESESYGQDAPCVESPGAGADPVPVHADLSGLIAGTTYHFRISAANANGVANGADQTFRTSKLPGINREYVANASSSGADLKADINPNLDQTTYHFEYGSADCASNPCASVPATEAVLGSGASVLTASRHVGGLSPDTIYHYRVVATNVVGTVNGLDHTFHTFPIVDLSASLPDNRAYEMVSPIDKAGGSIHANPFRTRSSASGDAITYSAFTAFADAKGSSIVNEYLARRTPNGWSTHSLIPSQQSSIHAIPNTNIQNQYVGDFSADLSKGIIRSRSFLTNAPNVDKAVNLYLRENSLADVGPDPGEGAQYTLLSDAASPLTFDEKNSGNTTGAKIALADAIPDLSHVIYESLNNLTTDATAANLATNRPKVYEWDNGSVRLAGVLPDGNPSTTSFAGPGAGQFAGNKRHYTQNTLSTDGSKVFFTGDPVVSLNFTQAGGNAYMRQDHAVTVQLNASERSTPDPNGPKPAVLALITPDGSKALIETRESLTDEDTNNNTGTGEGAMDLYMYDTTKLPSDPHNLTLISQDNELSDQSGESCGCGSDRVKDLIGISDDGSYVYFFSGNKLVPGQSSIGERGDEEDDALYVWHNDTVRTFGTVHSTADPDMLGNPGIATLEDGLAGHGARLTPDGRKLVFTATTPLTGYDNAAQSGEPCSFGIEDCIEVYLYSYDSDTMVCLSCNPTGAPPVKVPGSFVGYGNAKFSFLDVGSVYGNGGILLGATQHLTNAFLSDGSKAFFTTSDALVPQDTNGRFDAYEYDTVTSQAHLISTGQCNCNSTFVEASADGSSIFFTTRQQLVRSDTDNIQDLYDARIGGGIPSQNALPPAQCEGDACQSAAIAPNDATPASSSYSGPGNPRAKFKRHRHRKRHQHKVHRSRHSAHSHG